MSGWVRNEFADEFGDLRDGELTEMLESETRAALVNVTDHADLPGLSTVSLSLVVQTKNAKALAEQLLATHEHLAVREAK